MGDSHLRAERGHVRASTAGAARGRAHVSHWVASRKAPRSFQMKAEGQSAQEKTGLNSHYGLERTHYLCCVFQSNLGA